ncbi:MAG TPA: hypothetical protein VFU82_07115 [Gammaproteobacteria bacterium]|nr:hypothetical protein [Gammaproteobacteria bacterium]
MKDKVIILAAVLMSLTSVAAQAAHEVEGYYRSNGTYVEPHWSMDPGEARSSGYSYHDNELVPNGY